MTACKAALVGVLGVSCYRWEIEPPLTAYEKREAEIRREVARLHFRVASFFRSKELYAWAREHDRWALDYDPSNEEARERVDAREGVQAKADPSAAGEASRMLVEGGGRIARMWVEAAALDPTGDAWRRALEFDPDNAAARAHLGYVRTMEKGRPRWQTPEIQEMYSTMTSALASAPEWELTDRRVESDRMGVALKKVQAGEFIVVSAERDTTRIGEMARFAEATRSMYAWVVGKKTVAFSHPVEMLFTGARDRYIDTFITDPRARDEARSAGGATAVTHHVRFTEESDPEFVVHAAAHSAVGFHIGERRAWLTEGLALFLTRGILGTEGWCHGEPRRMSRDRVKALVDERRDRPMADLMTATMAEMTSESAAKAGSVLEFMICEYRGSFLKFVEATGRENVVGSPETALQNAFGWTPDDLDERWRQWVRVIYK